MGIREKLDGPIGYSVIAVLLSAAVAIVIAGGNGGPVSKKTVGYYFYDLDKQELFVASEQYGLIESPSGGHGARAFVYACGNCDGERKIAWIEKYPPEVLTAMFNPDLDVDTRDELRLSRRLVKAVDGGDWVVAITPEGRKVQDESYPDCPKGMRLRACEPTPAEL